MDKQRALGRPLGTRRVSSAPTMLRRSQRPWSIDRARQVYSIPHWSDGYFDIDDEGRMCAQPRGEGGPQLALPEVIERATEAGLKLPLLVRFSDILGDRLRKMQAAFAKAMAELQYGGGYTAVYPIKVNQHFGVAGVLANEGGEGFAWRRAVSLS